jgi:hypothetical protein
MRLNDRRIELIARNIVDRLAGEEMIDLTFSEDDLTHLVAELIERDLSIEDAIQEEAVKWMRINRKHVDEGSDAWGIELDRQRDQLAIRRGYVLP